MPTRLEIAKRSSDGPSLDCLASIFFETQLPPWYRMLGHAALTRATRVRAPVAGVLVRSEILVVCFWVRRTHKLQSCQAIQRRTWPARRSRRWIALQMTFFFETQIPL
jgi:hypothetical protein